jgi:hypothetical protein
MNEKKFEIQPNKKFEIQPNKKFEVKYEYKTYSDSALLSEVEPIEEGMIDPVMSGRELETLVEYPLLEVAKDFISKGIKTHSSSANKNDLISGKVYIILDFDSLNDNNKKIAEKYEIYEQQYFKKEKFVKISIPVNINTVVGDIRKDFSLIASEFEDQSRIE